MIQTNDTVNSTEELWSNFKQRSIPVGTKGRVLGVKKDFILVKFQGFSCPKEVAESQIEKVELF